MSTIDKKSDFMGKIEKKFGFKKKPVEDNFEFGVSANENQNKNGFSGDDYDAGEFDIGFFADENPENKSGFENTASSAGNQSTDFNAGEGDFAAPFGDEKTESGADVGEIGEFVIDDALSARFEEEDISSGFKEKKKLTAEEKQEQKREKRLKKEERLIQKYEAEIARKEAHRRKTFTEIIRDVIPWKGDQPFDIVRKCILIIAVAAFIASVTMLAVYGVDSLKNYNTGNSVKDLYGNSGVDLDSINFPDGANAADFAALYAENPDTVGWIYVPNTSVDNVVVQGVDNTYYLTHDFYGKNSEHGTIMADYRAVISLSGNSKNTVLYGHHMRDGSMFASLKKYRTFSFYQQNPVITFDTLYGEGQYEIFSVFITNDEEEEDDGYRFDYNQVNFGTDTQFLEYIRQVEHRSIYNTNVTVSADDEILTLVTCVYDFNEARLVICARKLREGEEAADTSTAERNPSPLYPQAWYNKYGGSKPTFYDEEPINPNYYIDPSDSTVTPEEPSSSSGTSSVVSLPDISAPDRLTDSMNSSSSQSPAPPSSEAPSSSENTPPSEIPSSSETPSSSEAPSSSQESGGSQSQSVSDSGGTGENPSA